MNSEMNLFNPVDLELSRSTFRMTPTHSGTCVAGRLCVGGVWEILPGDSVKMDLRSLIKMSTPVYPTMDQLYLDVFFFFVPNRLVLGDKYGNPDASASNRSWAAVIGAQTNTVNAPLPAKGITVPVVYVDGKPASGTLNDYILGTNADSHGSFLNCLPWLSYFAIWNENFRDPNTSPVITWSFGSTYNDVIPYGIIPIDAIPAEVNTPRTASATTYTVVNALGNSLVPSAPATSQSDMWTCLPTYRFHGYFGSALPWPQRNSAGVELPLGDAAPVFPMSTATWQIDRSMATKLEWMGLVNGAANVQGKLYAGGPGTGQSGTSVSSSDTAIGDKAVIPGNLFADLRQATAANVNALRAAIQKQRWYEKLARSGNRFDELEYGLFGVRPHDSGLDQPLYLGGKRIPLNIEMVASTNGDTTASSGEGAGSLGALGAFSHTNDQDHIFYHSFDEWGTLMCVFTIRHHDTFSSGVEKMFFRETRDDYYFPTFAHLGEQAIQERELGLDMRVKSVFGYQQAWEEYRQFPDKVSGLLRVGENLDFMTYASAFSSPTLPDFLNASYQVESVDKTLAVTSLASGFQFVYQFTFDMSMRRCMPTYSIPGLMDHF